MSQDVQGHSGEHDREARTTVAIERALRDYHACSVRIAEAVAFTGAGSVKINDLAEWHTARAFLEQLISSRIERLEMEAL